MNCTNNLARSPLHWLHALIALAAALVLAACSGPADLPAPAAPLSPTIAQQPADSSVTPGGSATFAVNVANASSASYQWQVLNGATWTDIPGATAASYSVSGVQASQDGTQYRCVVNAGSATLVSAIATLAVVPAPVAPSITVHPADQAVTEPATATFDVTASGTAPLSYQWQRNTGGTWTAIAGATAASYTTPATVRTNDNGAQFRVVVTNGAGSATSNAAALTVNPAPLVPAFTAQPADITVTAPASATFSVTVSGVPAPTLQWQLSTDGGSTWNDIPGATGASYSTGASTTLQSGHRYRVVASNSTGSALSNPALLTVNPAPVAPSIAVQPADQTVTEPAAATFSVTAGGSAPLTYQWQRNVASTWTNITGANAASYTTPATVRANDNGAQFRVIVTNAVSSATSNTATLTVNPAPVAPAFTTQPLNVTVTEPATASFTVAATGTPAPALQWQSSTDGGTTWNNVSTGSGATTVTHTTAATTTAMNGWRYRAVATNSAGSATSSPATLTVNAQFAAPVITQQPANATVPSESAATFSVVATGSPSPTYQWQRQGPNGGGFFNVTGATSASYTTPSVYYYDDDNVTESGAQYRVVVTNSQGSVTSSFATLTVTPTALTGFTQISAGFRHVLALRSDGTVWAWGSNGYGQVGRTCNDCSPRPVNGLAGTFTQVLARGDTSFAVRNDGTVWAWGYNGNGQLGRDLAAGTNSSSPAQVVRQSDGQPLTGIVGVTMTNHGSFGGAASVLAWTSTGVAWKWGNAFIEPGLGGNPGTNFLAAVPHNHFNGSSAARSLNRAVAGVNGNVIYIDGAGTAGFWRCNGGGCSFGTTPATAFSTLGFIGTVIDLAADAGERVMLVRSDNTLWGQAYQDTGSIVWSNLGSPLVQIALPEGVVRVALGRFGAVSYAVGLSGAVYAAGEDASGQLGDGTAGGRRATFGAILTVDDATATAIGVETGFALRAGGAIWGWGDNFYRTNGTADSAGRRHRTPGWVQLEATPFATKGR